LAVQAPCCSHGRCRTGVNAFNQLIAHFLSLVQSFTHTGVVSMVELAGQFASLFLDELEHEFPLRVRQFRLACHRNLR